MPYTAEDFVLVGSRDPKDIADFEKALAYLEKTPAGKRLLDDMLENRAVAVHINRVGDNMVEHDEKVLFWDPSSALQILNEDDTAGGVISPALAFAHELAHYLDDTDYDIETYANDKWDNDAERYAGQIEAEIAEQLGEPVRGNHKGNVIEVPGVTHHTRENDDGTATWVWEDGNGNEREGAGYKPYPDPPDPIAGDGNERGAEGSSEENDAASGWWPTTSACASK